MARSNYAQYMDLFSGNKTFQLFGESKDLPPMIVENPKPGELVELNKRGYGVFMTVNETNGNGRKSSDIIKIRAVFADLDGTDPEPAMEDMPHLLVRSSPGKYHAYWFCAPNFPLEGFSGVQKAIAYKYNSDSSVHDLSRVLRVPGLMHQKKEPVPVVIAFKNPEIRKITYEEAVDKWPPVPAKKYSAKRFKKSKREDKIDVGLSVPDLLEKYGWKYYHGNHWTRPGKDGGVSGTLLTDDLFYCHTSSTCLKPGDVADAFELMSQYEFGGDKSKCALTILNR